MTILFIILIVVAAICLGFVVLIQNPKGGGLNGDISGLSNQFMGVKQTTDTLEKGTWIFAAFLAVACLGSGFLLKGKSASAGAASEVTSGKGTSDAKPKTQAPPANVPLNNQQTPNPPQQ
jgi:preprotein translocase subunit SecG